MSDYIELHAHTHYSEMDGLNTPDEYFVRAKELGMTHMAITDHGTLAGHREFQAAAKDSGIIPILGVEGYISSTDRFDRRDTKKRQDGTNIYNHIILLAQNETGLANLSRMNELAWSEGFYYKPRIDFELLEEYNEGLVLLSGCLSGLLAKPIMNDDMETALAHAKTLMRIAPDRFYIELQGHNPPELNQKLLFIADKFDLPIVATSDCHYAREEDLWIEEALLILSTNPKRIPARDIDLSKMQKMEMLERYNYLYPDRSMTFEKFGIFLHAAQQHRLAFAKQGIDREDLYTNTVKIAQSVGDYPYYEGLDLLPPPSDDPDEMLWRKTMDGMKVRGVHGIQKYMDRAAHEFDIIKTKGFSAYILIVADAVSWARRKNIMVGPGRGSGAGSLINYALGITDVDPLEFGLIFERFIDPERDDWPDVDMDYEDKRRDEVKDYMRRKYKHVASIATFTYFRDKNVIKDAAKVLGVPVSEVNAATKNVNAPPDHDFFDVFRESPQGKEFSTKWPEVMDLAGRLRGRIRNGGMHAAGIVLSKSPLSEVAPIQTSTNPKDKQGPRVPLIAVDMDQAAEIGLIKLDFLGLKALSIIDDTLELIKDRYGIEVDLLGLNREDQNVYKMLSEGATKGVFQCEASPYTKLLMRMKVNSFNDLSVSNALIRPGAMNVFGNSYLKRKAGKEKVQTIHPSIDRYLEDTYSLPIYQEQSMRLVSDLAGLGMSTANKVRKITAKKQDVKLLAKYKADFIQGATPKVGREKAEWLWGSIEETASYAFNKSHSVAYSMLSYWTAWLKYYYPQEFMVSVLNNEGDKHSVTDYLIEAKRLGMEIYLPHVNHSKEGFSIEGKGIRMGLGNIKNLSGISAAKIIDHAPYESYKELEAWVTTKGNGLNVRALQGLNAIGGAVFDDNPLHGRERSNFYEYLNIPEFDLGSVPPVVKTQLTSLSEYDEHGVYLVRVMVRTIKRGDGWTRIDFVDNTGSASAFINEDDDIVTGKIHILLISKNGVTRYCLDEDLTENKDNPFVKYLWELDYPDMPDSMYKVVAFKPRKTKTGKDMANMILADNQKNLTPVLVFDKIFKKVQEKAPEGAVVDIDLEKMKDGTLTVRNVL